MKISVVMAYYNRKNLLLNTLKSISESKCKDFEVIVVDDASDDDNRLEDLVNEFNFLNLIRLEPEDKWYKNSCIPFNKGFKKASGDVVIIQNPECFHTGDIMTYVQENLKEDDYFVFACFSLDKQHTLMMNSNLDSYKSIVYNQKNAQHGGFGWYNHSIYNPVGYHFASAINKKKLDLLNGFDERYAMGCNYDDVEFAYRVKKICNFTFVDDLIVLHQNHYDGNKIEKKNYTINKDLYNDVTLKENKVRVNI